MPTLLIAIDGSGYSDHAVDYAIRRAGVSREPVHVHLLNVQLPMVGVNVKLFIRQASLESYYHDEAVAVLDAPRRKLEAAGLQCEHHIGVGDPGQVIVDYARSTACDEIIIRRSFLKRKLSCPPSTGIPRRRCAKATVRALSRAALPAKIGRTTSG